MRRKFQPLRKKLERRFHDAMFARWRARGEADFLTRRALKLAPDNDEVKKVLWKGSWPFWRGEWTNSDYPHCQMRDNNELASIRDTFTAGRAIV